MKIKRRTIEVFSMSFLDVISCGFGAIILLLVLSLALEPRTLEFIKSDLSGKIEEIKKELENTAVESQTLQQELTQKKKTLQAAQQTLAQLKKDLEHARNNDPAAQTKVKEKLQAVVQTLTEEMRRLLNESFTSLNKDSVIGGIPVDSEYIIFVIDTSGSMVNVAWPMVVRKVEEVLKVYPNVKGIQVVNDMGNYMFGAYAGRWIPDTPARRKEVIRRLRHWQSFSNSSPVEGIKHAVRVYFRQGERISLYVFSDDFSSGSINTVLNEVARINKQDVRGKTRVRIHTFGFPVLFTNPAYDQGNKVRFAHLMRLLAEQNAGSFVGLTDVR
jgi:predicted Holliday junction resolvase-like endonuclease